MSTAPLVMPDVITGLSLLLLFVSMEQLIGWPAGRGMTTIIIAHVTFCMAYVTVVVQSRLSDMDESLEEAAMDLGARPVRVFFDVTIPVIAPALIAGWLLAFTLSLDDLVVASFVTGPGASTLPMVIFSKVRLGVSPDINALATIIIAIVALGVFIASWQMRRSGAAWIAAIRPSAPAGAREHWAEMTYGGALSFLRRRYTPRSRRRRRGGDGLSLRRRGDLPAGLPARAAGDPGGLGAARRAQGVPLGLRPAASRWRWSTAATPCSTRTIPRRWRRRSRRRRRR